MKKSKIKSVITAALLFMAALPALAQEDQGFTKFNVREDFDENGFQWFHDAELLAAGDKSKSNAMTIGWGGHRDFVGTNRPDCLRSREALHEGVHGQV